MIDINQMSAQAFEIAEKRGQYKHDEHDTTRALKHCAGEVVEAVEAYNDWTFLDTPKTDKKAEFTSELADIIMCVLSIAGAENIDIEKALKDCIVKNERRIK